jgi:hypothetical protein
VRMQIALKELYLNQPKVNYDDQSNIAIRFLKIICYVTSGHPGMTIFPSRLRSTSESKCI